MTDHPPPPPPAPLLPPEDADDANDDADLVNFASSLLDAADADSELPESTLDAATLDAVHAAINAPQELSPGAISTQNILDLPRPVPAAAHAEQKEPLPSDIGPAASAEEDKQDEVRILMWFRRDLRLHDNLALAAALELIQKQQQQQEEKTTQAAGRKVVFIPLYIVHRPKIMRCGANRFQFVLESVSDLADALAARGSRLVVARGDGVQVLRRLLPAWRITHLFFDAASEPFAIDRDNRAEALATRLGVQTHVTHGYTLYDLDAVVAGNEGEPPKTYTAFLRALAMQPKPPKPLPTPEKVPAPAHLPSELHQQVVDYWRNRLKPDRVVAQSTVKEEKTEEEDDNERDDEEEDDPEEKKKQLDEIAGPEQQFTLPEVTDFGYDAPERHPFIYGGEQIALSILRDYCRNEGRVVKFEKPKTSPAQTTPSASTTSLSPYLYFGCISPRTFLHHVRGIQEHHAKALSATPVSLDGQLLWREFFHCHGRANPYFDKMEESPTCLQIDWRWHTIPKTEEDMTDDDKLARSQFKAWTDGQTGFPWIDAIMIQLKEEGWMHHLARHSVACFLTRGDLYISWVRGLEVFQERLIDHDWSINAGNWLWLSSSYFFSAYFRVYSPSTFGKKWDPEGLFIRKYVPALSKMPVKYIYEPWKAPMTVQHAAGCLIGKDYPFPIVDHKIAMRRCMAGMKKSYAINEYGTPPAPKSPTSPHLKRPRENSSNSSETSEESTQ
ncbi:Cryptochrome-2 [Phytophthora pseudosyringae]|uniref:Cryptochrome-2 n=1 Tax=Phytophthora pseudosyringae TaxID=221518 RepID=A0A8T1WKN5_9STRA|nr:Cryptochrome-2 [Phytophthora pseudosyringae]